MNAKKPKPHLTSERRRLLLALSGGDINSPVVPVLFMLQGTGVKRLNCMLKWLVDNNIIGQVFMDWFSGYHQSSPLSAIQFLRSKIDKEPPRKLYGEDFM